MSRRTVVDTVAPVRPVAAVSSTRLIVPAARIASSTAARLDGTPADGPAGPSTSVMVNLPAQGVTSRAPRTVAGAVAGTDAGHDSSASRRSGSGEAARSVLV